MAPSRTKKGVNVPGVHLSMPYMSNRDRNDILFGIEQGFDLISASFVRNAQDIMEIRHLLDELFNSNIRIIAKIENQEGIDNIDEILTVAATASWLPAAIWALRSTLPRSPPSRKNLIDRAMSAGKICITATQMLDSMIVNPRPTRAEITDVANAIYDGTGAVMLSGETAARQVSRRGPEGYGHHRRGYRVRLNFDSWFTTPAVRTAACPSALLWATLPAPLPTILGLPLLSPPPRAARPPAC